MIEIEIYLEREKKKKKMLKLKRIFQIYLSFIPLYYIADE